MIARLRSRRVGERQMMVTAAGRVIRVIVRDQDPSAALDVPPLLLCNGIGGSLEVLQPFVNALGRQRTIIRFDIPGIGGSPAPTIPYHFTTLPTMLTGLLHRLDCARADVLGISWGGGLAQQLALTNPRLVRRLVLVATGTGMLMVPAQPHVLRHMLTPQRHSDPDYAERVAATIYGGSMRSHPERARELLQARTRSGTRRGYQYQLLAGFGWTSLPLLPLLRQPTLLLAGDDDPIIPLINAKIMHRLIPASVLHVYHGGHLELIAEPHRLAPVVESFLDGQTDRPITPSANGHGKAVRP